MDKFNHLGLILILAGLLTAGPLTAASSSEADLQVQFLESPLNPDGFAFEISPGAGGALLVSDETAGEIRRYSENGSSLTVYSGLGEVRGGNPGAGNMVWYIDRSARMLGRLDTSVSAETVTRWALPGTGNAGFNTAMDGLERIWVPDFSQPRLYRFTPGNRSMCTLDYSALATWGSPYLAFDGTYLWFSDYYDNGVLRLDPANNQLTRWEIAVSTDWDFQAEGLASDGLGGVWFGDPNGRAVGRLNLVVPSAPSLLRYTLPVAAGYPHMLALQGNRVWYAANDPAALGLLDPGDATMQSYTPLVSSTSLSPACQTLPVSTPQAVAVANLAPQWSPAPYEVNTPATGWTTIPLGPQAYPGGLGQQNGLLWAVDNGRQVILRAVVDVHLTVCKLEDLDGNPTTTSDQSPLEGWPISLWVDGVLAESLQTGADGCHTWEGLAAGASYQVREARVSGWLALGATSYDFGTANFGDRLIHAFINTQGYEIHLPLVVR